MSGADLAKNDSAVYLVIIGAALIIASFLILKNKNQLSKSKIYIVFGSLVGIGVMLLKYLAIKNKDNFDFIEIKWGAGATIVGFILSLIGINYLDDRTDDKIFSNNKANRYCKNCNIKLESDESVYCKSCSEQLKKNN